jgi:myo-inositol-1(or 4)-monophosphatase
VARGIYDGYFEPKLAPWDIAAGIVVVREASGRVTDYDGGPIDPFKGWVVASNGRIHSEMLAVIKDARHKLLKL